MNMVDENVEGDAEIAWLESEMEGLQPHTPDALAELEVQVTFLPIFCCCDGKTINGQLKNRWTKRCPFWCRPCPFIQILSYFSETHFIQS